MPNNDVYYAMKDTEFEDIADAVREVLGVSGAIKGSEIADYIRQTASIDGLFIQDSLIRINYEFPTALFKGNTKIQKVVIGDNVTTIPAEAFQNCTNLKEVHIGTGVTSIGNSAFSGCTYLKTVTGCQNVETIGSSAFGNCNALVTIGSTANKIDLPALTTIGAAAFWKCSSIEEIEMLSLIEIPDSNSSSGNVYYANFVGAFKDCTSLESVTFSVLTKIGSFAFAGCTSLETITGLRNVTALGLAAFYNCQTLSSINLPLIPSIPGRFTGNTSYQVSLRWYADCFQNCNSLTSVTFGSALETIGTYAFNGCSALQTITIPENVTSMGDYCFANCSNLETIILLRTTAITTATGSNTFSGCTKLLNNSGANAHIYVPSSLLSSYNVNYWNACSDKLTAYEVTMTIDGTDYTFEYGPLFDEWCTTNTDFVVSGNNILTSDKTKYLALNGNAVFPTDHAIGNTYTTVAI